MSRNIEFEAEVMRNIHSMSEDAYLKDISGKWFTASCRHKYSYNFRWMGRPVIQYPQDIMAMQEIIWDVKPDLVIETGIAHGGSIIFYASMLELLGRDGMVLGIDVDIRRHNREEIEKHPMSKRIKMVEGSSVDEEVIRQVREETKGRERVLVVLDSCHTYRHVLDELRLYSQLVTLNSYIVVFDTVIDDMPENFFTDRPWGREDNPKRAVAEFLKDNPGFAVDENIQNKLLITVAPGGYLKRVRE